MKQETERQAIHFAIGTAYIIAIYLLPKETAIPLLLGIFAIGSFISYTHQKGIRLPLVKEIILLVEREKEMHLPGKGALSFTLGILLSSIIFYPFDKLVLIGAATALTFGDGISTLMGKRYGKTKTIGERTLEGTITGIIGATISLALFFPIEIALPTAIFAMLAEYLPVNDNYTIPLVAGAILLLIL